MKKFLKVQASNNGITKNINMGKNKEMDSHKRSYSQLMYHKLAENDVEDTDYIQYVKDVVIIHICRPE